MVFPGVLSKIRSYFRYQFDLVTGKLFWEAMILTAHIHFSLTFKAASKYEMTKKIFNLFL